MSKSPRAVNAEKRCEEQWQQWHSQEKFGYGLVIGLPSLDGPDYIVHSAFTLSAAGASNAGFISLTAGGELQQVQQQPDLVQNDAAGARGDNNLARSAVPAAAAAAAYADPVQIDVEDLIQHALNALRMLPGCCFVLGLFTIERKLQPIESAAFRQQVKALRSLAAQLQKENWIYGPTDLAPDLSDKFILNYAGDGAVRIMNVPCAVDDKKMPPLIPLQLSVAEKRFDWVSFYSQLDEPYEFRIARKADGSASITDNVWACVSTLYEQLKNTRIFMEAQPLLNIPGTTIGEYAEAKSSDSRVIETKLYMQVEDPIEGAIYGANRRNGYVRSMGEVAAYVFAHPDQQIADMERYLKSDILRSVAGRLRLYLDAYADMPDSERLVSLCRIQPPRRCFFWPFLGEKIQFCDYLFDKEDAEVTALNARDVFGLTIQPYMVNQAREKMRLPPNQAYTIDPEMPKLYTNMIRGAKVLCNTFFLLGLLVGIGAVLFVTLFGTKYAESKI